MYVRWLLEAYSSWTLYNSFYLQETASTYCRAPNLIPSAENGITNFTWKNSRLLLQITAQFTPPGPSNPHSTSNRRPPSAEKGLPNSTWTL